MGAAAAGPARAPTGGRGRAPGVGRAAKATVQAISTQQALHPARCRIIVSGAIRPSRPRCGIPVRLSRSDVAEPKPRACRGLAQRDYVSVDEKPACRPGECGLRLPQVAGQRPTVARDHGDKRFGTASILAALDLRTGQSRRGSSVAIGVTSSLACAGFRSLLSARVRLRLVLDDHSAHFSKETQAYLATLPDGLKSC